MTTNRDLLEETVVVRVGVLGAATEGIGTAFVHAALSGSSEERAAQVGTAMGDAYRDAYMQAVREMHPILLAHFRAGDPLADQGNDVEGPSV